eukprot:m.1392110 g.1392110  ORF g.1392110 m.1392110 type:complete len:61 (-) comp24991_c0_seq57:4738-4920(-)
MKEKYLAWGPSLDNLDHCSQVQPTEDKLAMLQCLCMCTFAHVMLAKDSVACNGLDGDHQK